MTKKQINNHLRQTAIQLRRIATVCEKAASNPSITDEQRERIACTLAYMIREFPGKKKQSS